MELYYALALAAIGLIIIWKLFKGIARTVSLVIVAALLAWFVLSGGGYL